MKQIRHVLFSAFYAIFAGIAGMLFINSFTACQTPPSQRVVQYQTLKAVGLSAQATVNAAAQALKQGAITVEQWQKVATFYDTKFQPAYALAVAAAQSDLSSVASPDLVNLAVQLAALIPTLSSK